VEISDGAIIKCNYELCAEVVNESDIQSKAPSRVILIRGNIFMFLAPSVLDVSADLIISVLGPAVH
jgi:hypothetical protein